MTDLPRVSVIGLGYIGLPTAALMASKGFDVTGVDVSESVVNTINAGNIHIVETDLEEVVRAAVAAQNLRAMTQPEPADVFIIAVPTPFMGPNHDPDTSYVMAAAAAIAPVLQPGNLVILESTSPVGTTEAMADVLAQARPDLSFPGTSPATPDICVAHCPERVLPGKILKELVTNDRVIGGLSPRCSEAASQLYRVFVTGECVIASSPRVAEMAKLTENSFRDVNIAFANELSKISERLDIDVWELIALANRHPRVNILNPGPGVGGHCIAVDPWFIVSSAPEQSPLIATARGVNDTKPAWVVEQILKYHKPGDDIILYGLAYKPNVDDLRESPAVDVAVLLGERVSDRIILVEPFVDAPPVQLSAHALHPFEDTLNGDASRVLLVPHDTFKAKADQLRALGTLDFCGAIG